LPRRLPRRPSRPPPRATRRRRSKRRQSARRAVALAQERYLTPSPVAPTADVEAVVVACAAGAPFSIVADAAEFARISPEPDPSELFTDIYVGAER
jgi:TPP-dependent pyruvate/acetoin dehydrogenase alpha subunit